MSQLYIFLKSVYLFTKIFIEGLLHARHISRCKCRKYHDLFTWLLDNEHLGHLQCFALQAVLLWTFSDVPPRAHLQEVLLGSENE